MKKIFKLTAKELKVLRGGVKMADSKCNSASWAANAAQTEKNIIPRPKVKKVRKGPAATAAPAKPQ